MNPNIEEPERRLIRDAMTRLLDGDPIRSDGKLHREIAGGRGRIEALVPNAQTHRSAR